MTHESTMIERLARSFIVPLGHDPSRDWARTYVGTDASLRVLCLDLARAALEALREPTPAMVETASVAWNESEAASAEELKAAACRVWQAMIDAALADEGGG